jgi:carboxymethylenebutenolidase
VALARRFEEVVLRRRTAFRIQGAMEDGLELVRFAGHGGDLVEGVYAAPQGRAGERAPALVIAPEVFGIDPHMRDVTKRFAAEGFAALALDVWSRSGVPGPRASAAALAPKWTPEQVRAAVYALPDRRVLGDLEGALAWLAARGDVDAKRLAAVGFCMGGNHVYQLGCHSRRVAAVVDFYGRLVYAELNAAKPMQPIEYALNLSVPLLAFFGERDSTIPPEHVAAFRERLEQGCKNFEIVSYSEAGHGFFNDTRTAYRKVESEDAWRRTLEFLREQLEVEG